jgi:hypothetical protein
MIADSLARQFLLKYKHIIRISVIEDDLGITGKSIYKWIIGKKPLPDKWSEPLFKYLYPMLDENSKVQNRHFQQHPCLPNKERFGRYLQGHLPLLIWIDFYIPIQLMRNFQMSS